MWKIKEKEIYQYNILNSVHETQALTKY